jgi:hypothetical protein
MGHDGKSISQEAKLKRNPKNLSDIQALRRAVKKPAKGLKLPRVKVKLYRGFKRQQG